MLFGSIFMFMLVFVPVILYYFHASLNRPYLPDGFLDFGKKDYYGKIKKFIASEYFNKFINYFGEDKVEMGSYVSLGNNWLTSIELVFNTEIATAIKDKIRPEILLDIDKIHCIRPKKNNHEYFYDKKIYEFNSRKPPSIAKIEIKQIDQFLAIDKYCVEYMVVDENISGTLHVVNCWIKILTIKRRVNKAKKLRIDIGNSRIFKLVLDEECCENLNIYLSHIVYIDCARDNPINGIISIDNNSSIYKNSSSYAKQEGTIQNYRNLRKLAESKSNMLTSEIVRETELRMERDFEKSIFMKIINYLYDYTSRYGRSPQRSVALLAITTFVNYYLILAFEVCNVYPEHFSKNRYFDSFMLLIQTEINPFSIFSKTNIYSANDAYCKIYLLFSSLVSISLLSLTFFAIRRRFKLS